MVHLGDITAINGSEIAQTNCIVFGSPCTDLSVAGKGKGYQERKAAYLWKRSE